MKSNDVVFLLMGLAISVFGMKVFIQREFDTFKYGVVNFGENHQLIGVAILIFGGFIIFSGLKKR